MAATDRDATSSAVVHEAGLEFTSYVMSTPVSLTDPESWCRSSDVSLIEVAVA